MDANQQSRIEEWDSRSQELLQRLSYAQSDEEFEQILSEIRKLSEEIEQSNEEIRLARLEEEGDDFQGHAKPPTTPPQTYHPDAPIIHPSIDADALYLSPYGNSPRNMPGYGYGWNYSYYTGQPKYGEFPTGNP